MPRLDRGLRTGFLAGVLAALVCCWLASPPVARAGVPGLLTGFTDSTTFEYSDQPTRVLGLRRARAAGASIVRLTFTWATMERVGPPSQAVGIDPSWPGYDWAFADSVIRDAAAAGLTPVFEVNGTPRWAEGPGRPPVSPTAPTGSWRPSVSAFETFAQAAATRYSGHFPDPDRPGLFLPRVRYWQGWNEPNLSNFLSPQWVQSGNRLAPESPNIYRALLNGWYRGIKAADRSNVVVTAGTAPFGDLHPGDPRMSPALFIRQLFCLSGRHSLRKFTCPDSPLRFDVLAHHPYPVGPPRRHARTSDDVAVPDFAKLTRPLQAALKQGTVAPRGHKPLWATEFSWDSNPPDPGGVPAQLEARYMEGAFSELRSEGVSVALWYLLRDQSPNPSFAKTLQSGIYLRGPTIAEDRPKPSFTSFSFPFTAYLHRGRAELWGIAPAPGRVVVQARRKGRWRTLARVRARRGDRMFVAHRKVAPRTGLRARQGGRTSLTWTVFSPG
jgi:hypothetical protein